MLARHRYTRRQLLKLGGGAAASLALLRVTDWLTPQAARAAVRSEWTLRDGLPASGVFETPVLRADGPFNAVDLSWLSAHPDGDGLTFWARVSADGATWSDWLPMPFDPHQRAGDLRGYSAPLLADGVAVQARVEIEAGAGLREFTIGTLDTSSDPSARSLAAAAPLIDGFIIPRAGWGADESLRHEDQDLKKPIVWPPEYEPVVKVIVHHTATQNNPPDPAAAIRAVYFYHAVTRGWGDIGYNFLVDARGKVYEGRFGGPNVVGGHALQYNYGSIGIALLGDFSDIDPSHAMFGSLARLIEDWAPQVDVTSAADFVDLLAVPNLCGHGDVLPTSCPGEQAHALLPVLRGTIAGTDPIYLDPPVLPEGLKIIDCQIGPPVVYQGNLLEVRLRVSNPTAEPLPTQGPEPGYIYDESENFNDIGFPKEQDCYRFTLDFGSNVGLANPYRWGFGEPLQPGETRDVVGYVRRNAIDNDTWYVGIIQEFVEYVDDHDFGQDVSVEAPPTSRSAQSADATVRYFAETGHNVPEPFAGYWDNNGGLTRFGYPLTEAFEEVSETDGGRYVTQYFERARFEWHPDYAGTEYEVQLGLLGAETTAARADEPPFQRIEPFVSDDDHLYFPETGHSLSNAFKDYWRDNGGLPIFGYPISEEYEQLSETDGQTYIVQYFERNRFEYHPEFAGTQYEVLLGHLGREVLIDRGWLP